MFHLKMNYWLGKFWRITLVLVLVVLLPMSFHQRADAAPCENLPSRPKLVQPAPGAPLNGPRVKLHWHKVECALNYSVEVRKDVTWGRPLDAAYELKKPNYRTRRLI